MAYHHLGEVVHQQALKYRHRTAIKYQEAEGIWQDMSWKAFSESIMKAAQAMAEMGVKPGDNLGVYSQNMEKYLVTDFAAYANRAVMVPMYATASPAQVSYIVRDAAIRILFVGEQFQYNNAWKVQQESPLLEKLIIFDRRVVKNTEDSSSVYFDDFIATGDNSETIALVNARLKQLKEQDLATIIYHFRHYRKPKG